MLCLHIHTPLTQTRKKKKKKVRDLNSPQIGLVLNSEPGIERDRKDLTSELWGWEALKKKKRYLFHFIFLLSVIHFNIIVIFLEITNIHS